MPDEEVGVFGPKVPIRKSILEPVVLGKNRQARIEQEHQRNLDTFEEELNSD